MQKQSLAGVLTHTQKKAVSTFLQSGDQADQPQSGQIFGILKNMKDEFEANLGTLQKEESQNQASYEQLKAAKEEEIKSGQNQLDTKTQQSADTDEKKRSGKRRPPGHGELPGCRSGVPCDVEGKVLND